jgi:hypothetical protein
MLGIVKQQAALKGAITAIADRPLVMEAKKAFDDARAQYDEAKTHLDMLERALAPVMDSAASSTGSADEIVTIRAQAALPQARQAYWEAQARLKVVERAFQTVVEAETKALTLERAKIRRGLVQRLFARLDEAKSVAEEIEAYDRETTTLGAKAQAHPFGELLDETYRTGYVTFRRQLLQKEGAL